jgi:hypothetical protein
MCTCQLAAKIKSQTTSLHLAYNKIFEECKWLAWKRHEDMKVEELIEGAGKIQVTTCFTFL